MNNVRHDALNSPESGLQWIAGERPRAELSSLLRIMAERIDQLQPAEIEDIHVSSETAICEAEDGSDMPSFFVKIYFRLIKP